jgi:ribonuclease HII
MRNLPTFHYEKMVWKHGFQNVAGIDEVGRGAFAGPVVAGCVVFKPHIPYSIFNIRIDDSKRLTPKQRNIAEIWIKENCLTWGIGEASAHEIDRLGIVKATRKAMRKSIGNANQRLHDRIQYLLIDAFYLPYIKGIRMPIKYKRKSKFLDNPLNSSKSPLNTHKNKRLKYDITTKGTKQSFCEGCQTAIVKGDQKSLSIASASIVAKVYRDNLMINLGKRKKFKKYGWENNKGYGTLLHRRMVEKYGSVYLHRKSFIKY